MADLDASILRDITPHVGGAKGQQQAQIIDAVGAVLADTLNRYGIDSDLRVAHFLAQAAHESDAFCTTVEYASGDAYEGRRDLGNTQPGDGRRYKGRGLFQLTGRANYKKYGEAMGMDLEGDPTLAAEPATSLAIACQYWTDRNLNAAADADDIQKVTRGVNGGLNGLADRQAYLVKAKAALAG